MGLVTPLGGGLEENWRNLCTQKSGIGCYLQPNHPEAFHYLGKVAQVPLPQQIEPKLSNQMKFLNRGSLLGLAAAHQAITQSGSGVTSAPPERRGMYIGAGDFTKVGYEFMFPAIREATDGKYRELDYRKLNVASVKEVNPFFLLESIHNNLFSFLSACFKIQGPNTTLAGASPSGAQAVELACRCIQQDSADVALAVGCGNWISEIPLYELLELGLLSRCKDGIHSLKPFDRRRDGFIAGEGGAALLLEEENHAKQRGAKSLGSVKGTGNCIEFSSDHKWRVPDKVSLRSMQMALAEAASDVGDLAFICPHGSATVKGDRSELRSLMAFLDARIRAVPVCGLKGYTAHLGAASDIAEIILGIDAIRNGLAPGTLNFGDSEEEFSELRISSIHQRHEKRHFLSVSCGLGGQCCSVLIEGSR
jgi:3-oxoacyl-[acyl-carrier-protein] synthase II